MPYTATAKVAAAEMTPPKMAVGEMEVPAEMHATEVPAKMHASKMDASETAEMTKASKVTEPPKVTAAKMTAAKMTAATESTVPRMSFAHHAMHNARRE